MREEKEMMMETPTHKSLYSALAAAQSEMGRAKKDSKNPHFKSSYADLSSVMDACMPSLTKHGIAVLQPAHDEGGERYVKTIFAHGESGETMECRVPLIVNKNDMQGYGSAVTYARRYGLMGMAGIAPDDDDGNAAAKAPPERSQPAQIAKVLPEQAKELHDLADRAGSDRAAIFERMKIQGTSWADLPAQDFDFVRKGMASKIMEKEHDAAVAQERKNG